MKKYEVKLRPLEGVRNHQVSGSTPLGGSSEFEDLQNACKSLLFTMPTCEFAVQTKAFVGA
jgi:hypothetical protein